MVRYSYDDGCEVEKSDIVEEEKDEADELRESLFETLERLKSLKGDDPELILKVSEEGAKVRMVCKELEYLVENPDVDQEKVQKYILEAHEVYHKVISFIKLDWGE